MEHIGHGLTAALGGIVTGLIVQVILSALGSALPQSSMALVEAITFLIGIFGTITVMKYWGTWYLVGWLFGSALMARVGLISGLEMTVYFLVAGATLFLRLTRRL